MNLKVYDKQGTLLFDGSPLDGEGQISQEIPAPVRDYIIAGWKSYGPMYDDFEHFWSRYVKHRMVTSLGLAYQGFGLKVE